jgi:hypothetical protein
MKSVEGARVRRFSGEQGMVADAEARMVTCQCVHTTEVGNEVSSLNKGVYNYLGR